MQNRIVIISYTFPPNPGIGGRRWLKFAKYLQARGHYVHVIASESIDNVESVWQADLAGLKVDYLPFKYPKALSLPVRTFFDKLRYHLSLRLVKLLDSGNYHDKAIFWKKQIQDKVRELLSNEKIDTVIVTGAPFRLVYYVTALKNEFKEVRFIADFRDLWTTDTEVSAFSKLSLQRKSIERVYEKLAVLNSDFVFTVADKMRTYFRSLSNKDNCVLIPNGFDPQEIKSKHLDSADEVISQQKVVFVFAGTLYNNIEYILLPFFEGLAQLKVSRPELFGVLSLEFYGKFPIKYKQYVLKYGLEDVVNIRGEAAYATVSSRISKAHYGLLFLNDLYNFSFSTKFCEYIGLNKKIMVVANGGATSDFVTKNNLGVHLEPTKTKDVLAGIIDTVVKRNFSIETNAHYDASQFSIAEITTKIEQYLKN